MHVLSLLLYHLSIRADGRTGLEAPPSGRAVSVLSGRLLGPLRILLLPLDGLLLAPGQLDPHAAFALDEASGVEDGEHDQGDAHHGEVEEVGRPFVVGEVAVDAGGEFAEAEDDADGDEAEHGVEGREEELCGAEGAEGVVRHVLLGEGGGGVGVGVAAVDFDVEADG